MLLGFSFGKPRNTEILISDKRHGNQLTTGELSRNENQKKRVGRSQETELDCIKIVLLLLRIKQISSKKLNSIKAENRILLSKRI